MKKRKSARHSRRNLFPDERILDMLNRVPDEEQNELFRRNKLTTKRNTDSIERSSAWLRPSDEAKVSGAEESGEQKSSSREPGEADPTPSDRRLTVYTDHLADNAVTNEKLANRSVDGSKIQYGSIQKDHLADFSVDASKLAEGAVTDAKIAPDRSRSIIFHRNRSAGITSGGRPSRRNI